MRSKIKDRIETKVNKHGEFFQGIDRNIYDPIPIICPECGAESVYNPTEKNKIFSDKKIYGHKKYFSLVTKCECGCEFSTRKYLYIDYDFAEICGVVFVITLVMLFVFAFLWSLSDYKNLWEILLIIDGVLFLVSCVVGLYFVWRDVDE